MSDQEAKFIKIETEPGQRTQTLPVAPDNRLAPDEISISLCDVDDVEVIAEGLYSCFSEATWAKMEPLSQRPDHTTRIRRQADRLRPTFSVPQMTWVKATLTSTGKIVGIAGWQGPGMPVHNVLRRTAVDFYGFPKQFGWSDEDVKEMWSGVDIAAWEAQLGTDDEIRAAVLGNEPHWFLAPLFTMPEYQGRGVGKKLLDWAIKQADATDPVTPMYLESAPHARAVYMHVGFVPVGKKNFVRRGPRVVTEDKIDESFITEKKVEAQVQTKEVGVVEA